MTMLKRGDKIRILADDLEYARVEAGDELTVLYVGLYNFHTEAPRLRNIESTWLFGMDDEGTGWERVQ